MSKPDLKDVSKIPLPDYKDPVKMLRNLADSIENGGHGEVTSVAVATFGDAGLEVYGGGVDSDPPTAGMMFQAAAMKMCQSLVDFESTL